MYKFLVPKKQKTSSDYISNIFNIKINPRIIKKDVVTERFVVHMYKTLNKNSKQIHILNISVPSIS